MTQNGKYDFITFVIDFIGARFLFQNSFYTLPKQSKGMTFKTLFGPGYKIFLAIHQYIFVPLRLL